VANTPAAQWAIGQVGQALESRGIALRVCHRIDQVQQGQRCIVAAGTDGPVAREVMAGARIAAPDAAEGLVLAEGRVQDRRVLLAAGQDPRGLSYALTELSDAVRLSSDPYAALERRTPLVEHPANGVRSVMRVFASDVEDKGWFQDKAFWPAYLDMLAAQRFNRFNLALGVGYDFATELRDTYFYFAYPFLVEVPGYQVRASGLADAERDLNLQMLRFISDETARRGLQFQLGLWTHAYQWSNSPDANYVIEGLDREHHGPYCRDALTQVLKACPSISGVTFRIHGESGVAEGNYAFWKTIFDGVVAAGRPIEIDMHAKGMDQGMIDVALATGMPVTISPKFWAEHMGLPYHQAAIRDLERPAANTRSTGLMALSAGSRSFLRYGYGDLLAEDRRYQVLHRIWPGTQRVLLWGDPAFAAAYSRAFSFCGSAGVELFEPLSFKGRKGSGLPGGRDGYADSSLRPVGGDWRKYLYTYRLWGRLAYNPQTDPEVWRRQLRQDYGPAAEPVEAGLARASRILPLVTTAHDPSAANNGYWPEMYLNMPIAENARAGLYGDSPSPRRFGTVSPLDPQLFDTIDGFTASLVAGPPSAKTSPLEVAWQLEDWSNEAATSLATADQRIHDRRDPVYRRTAVDVAIAAGLGKFFAWKLRAGVLYGLFERSGQDAVLQEALKAYRRARQAWAVLASKAEGVYVGDVTYGLEPQLRGHWSDRLEAIDRDVAVMERQRGQAKVQGPDAEAVARLTAAVLARPHRPAVGVTHTPARSFSPGQNLEIRVRPANPGVTSVVLWHRRVNQAETFRQKAMAGQQGEYQATIEAEYTRSAFPLQYYFELRSNKGQAWLYPGFCADFLGQPYFVVQQTSPPVFL
jgi:hypothetical protein